MSRIAYFQAFSGASGDMFLGALVDGGWPVDELVATLSELSIRDYRVKVENVMKGAVAATSVSFEIEGHDHAHRGLRDILAILDGSGLGDSVRERASSMFNRLARVEAKVHGETVEDIHFHEVGAIDSILDVVGAAAGLEWLDADEIVVSPINTGGGVVNTLAGKIPVPGMATLLLAQEAGAPVYSTSDSREFLTTTGSLVLTSAATGFGPLPAMTVERIGYGAGTADFDLPNVLRVVIGNSDRSDESDVATVIETNLDDVPADVQAYVMERLLDRGALDAFITPIVMKKGRAASKLTVLAEPNKVDSLTDVLFAETPTLGVRMYETRRRKLERDARSVATPWGDVGVKVSFLDGRVRDASPEYEDCRAAAAKAGVPLRKVMDHAREAMLEQIERAGSVGD